MADQRLRLSRNINEEDIGDVGENKTVLSFNFTMRGRQTGIADAVNGAPRRGRQSVINDVANNVSEAIIGGLNRRGVSNAARRFNAIRDRMNRDIAVENNVPVGENYVQEYRMLMNVSGEGGARAHDRARHGRTARGRRTRPAGLTRWGLGRGQDIRVDPGNWEDAEDAIRRGMRQAVAGSFSRSTSNSQMQEIHSVQIIFVPVFNAAGRALVLNNNAGGCYSGATHGPKFKNVKLVTSQSKDNNCGLVNLVRLVKEYLKKPALKKTSWFLHVDRLRKVGRVVGDDILLAPPIGGGRYGEEMRRARSTFYVDVRKYFGIEVGKAIDIKTMILLAKDIFRLNLKVMYMEEENPLGEFHGNPDDDGCVRAVMYLYEGHYWLNRPSEWDRREKKKQERKEKAAARRKEKYVHKCPHCKCMCPNLENHVEVCWKNQGKKQKKMDEDRQKMEAFARAQEVKYNKSVFHRERPLSMLRPDSGIMNLDMNEDETKVTVDRIVEKITNEPGYLASIQGSAGTGKTYLIKKLIEKLPRDSVMCMTPTGAARAVLSSEGVLGVTTVDYILYRYADYRQKKTLVFDELSMITWSKLERLHKKLCYCDYLDTHEERNKHDLWADKPWFNGRSVIFVGDFSQLPPVKADLIFKDKRWAEKIRDMEFYRLQTNRRFKNLDGSMDEQFFCFLERVRTGSIFELDEGYIRNRVFSSFEKIREDWKKRGIEGDKALILTSTNKECTDFINKHFFDETKEVVEFEHKFTPNGSMLFDRQSAAYNFSHALDPRNLRVRMNVGMRLMGIRNLTTSKSKEVGLGEKYFYNGVLCTLKGVDRKNGRVWKMLVEFDDEPGKIYSMKQLKMKINSSFGYKKMGYVYEGFPFISGDALTIHKAQGKTSPLVVVCWDNLRPDSGVAYVALSRAKHFRNLYILSSSFVFRSKIAFDTCLFTYTKLTEDRDADSALVESYIKYLQEVEDEEESTIRVLSEMSCKSFGFYPESSKVQDNSFEKLILFDAESWLEDTENIKMTKRSTAVDDDGKVVVVPVAENVKKHSWYSCYARIYMNIRQFRLMEIYAEAEEYKDVDSKSLKVWLDEGFAWSDVRDTIKVGDVFFLQHELYDEWAGHGRDRKYQQCRYPIFNMQAAMKMQEEHCPGPVVVFRVPPGVEVHTTFMDFMFKYVLLPGCVMAKNLPEVLKKKDDLHLKKLRKELLRAYTMAAANGAGYDFHWLVKYFIDRKNESQEMHFLPCLRGKNYIGGRYEYTTKVWTGKIKKVTFLKLHDLLAMLSIGSLKSHHSSYCPDKEYTKDIFPHQYVTSKGAAAFVGDREGKEADFYEDGQIDKLWQVCADKYTREQRALAAASCGSTDRYRVMAQLGMVCPFYVDQLVKYNKMDVVLMDDLYRSLDKFTMEYINQPCIKITTAARMAWTMFNYVAASGKYARYFCPGVDVKKLKKSMRVKTQLCYLKKDQEAMVRRSCYGGRCETRISVFEPGLNIPAGRENAPEYDGIEKYLECYDINGMYAGCLRDNKYPMGMALDMHNEMLEDYKKMYENKTWDPLDRRSIALLRQKLLKTNTFFFLEVDVEPNVHNIEPSVPGYEQTYDEDSKKWRKEKITWCVRPKTHQVYNHVHVFLLLKSGGKITKIHRGLYFPSKPLPIFEEYITKALAIKKEGDQMNAVEKGSGAAKRSFGKLLCNAAYGVTLQACNDEAIVIARGIKEFTDFFDQYEYISHEYWDDGTVYFRGMKIEQVQSPLARSVCYLGSYVLSYSHLMFDKFVDAMYGDRRYAGDIPSIKNQIYYSDTDSFYPLPGMGAKLIKAGLVMDNPNEEEEKKILAGGGTVVDVTGKCKDDYQPKGKSCVVEWNYKTGMPSKVKMSKLYHFCLVAKKHYAMEYIDYTGKYCGKSKQKGVSYKKPLLKNKEQTSYVERIYSYQDMVDAVVLKEKEAWRRHEQQQHLPTLSREQKKNVPWVMNNSFGSAFQKTGLTEDPRACNLIYCDNIERSANFNPITSRRMVRWKENEKWVLYHTVPLGWRYKGSNPSFEKISDTALYTSSVLFEEKNNKDEEKSVEDPVPMEIEEKEEEEGYESDFVEGDGKEYEGLASLLCEIKDGNSRKRSLPEYAEQFAQESLSAPAKRSRINSHTVKPIPTSISRFLDSEASESRNASVD